MKRLVVSLIIGVVCLAASTAWAQNAQLSGRVADQSGAVVPKANVIVLNEGTGTRRATETNDEGLYSVTALMPGTYKVSVQMDGFKIVVRTGVKLEVAQNARLDFTLEAAPTQETVTVAANASSINTTDGAVGTVINRQFVENLPMNGRSFQSLILLTPGVATNTPQSAAAVGYSGEFSINGQRTESNRFTVDGVSASNGTYVYGYGTAGSAGALPTGTTMGTTQSLVSLDALEEFRVLSSTYSAEYGRSPGGQFSFVSRSGTNAWHGSAFDYVRNDAFDANDWFNNRYGVEKPKEQQNDFGGTLGGPVMIPGLYNGRDRSFFFASYEGLRVKQPLAATVTYVPSVELRQKAPPALQGWLNAYPLPTGANLANGLAEYLLTDSLPSRLDSTNIRIDHSLASAHRLFFRYSNTPSNTVTRSTTYYERRKFTPQSITVGSTDVIGSRLTNELRVGYSPTSGGYEEWMVDTGGAQPFDLVQQQGVDLAQYPTAFVYAGLYFPGYTSTIGISSLTQKQRQLNVVDTVDFIAGRHQFKFGIDYLRTASDLQRTDPYVYVLFNSADAVYANSSYQAAVIRFGPTHPVFTSFGAFVQDEWRLSSRLALSLGVRWEVNPAPGVSAGALPRVISGDPGQPSTLALAPEGTPMWKTTYDNFAPRVGLAYVLRSAPGRETVLRAGSGIFFDSGQNVRNSTFDSNPGATATRNYGTSYGSAASWPLTPPQLAVTPELSLVPPYGTSYLFGPDFKLPYTVQWNLSVEQALGAPQSLTVSYVGARGQRLLQQVTTNAAPFNPDFTYVTATQNGLTSAYDSLQAQYQRRLHRGLQAMASYTWAHAIDYGSDNRTLPAKRGNSAYDVRHSFTAAVTYEIPAAFKHVAARSVLNGWSIDGRFTARSAYPVTLNGNTLTDPATGQQFYGGLDLVPGVPFYIDNANAPGGRQINPAAFALPASNQVGTAPRNFVRGFGATQLDAVLRRDFPLSPTVRLQFRLEAFNMLNHPNFGLVNATFGNALFGQPTKTLSGSLGGLSALYQQGGPRSLQLSLRVLF